MQTEKSNEVAQGLRSAATVSVTRQYLFKGKPNGNPETKNETLDVRTFVTEPAKVRVSFSITLNLGNYESAKADIGIDLPCYAEEANDAYVFAKDWVEERLHAEVDDIKRNKPSLF